MQRRLLQNADLLKWMTESIPPLESSKHKGQAGKICVIGGSKEYTGAPYFSAISALLCGADLVHIICPEDAATVIKSYSPELIVHPILNKNNDECCRWLSRMDAVVIGPGLGRENVDDSMNLIKFIRDRNIPLVIDADGLHLIGRDKSLIAGYKRAILTPNVVESKMLLKSLLPNATASTIDSDNCAKLASILDNVTVVMKGMTDIITDGNKDSICDAIGSPRRCGGQGDLLGGTAALMLHWCLSSNVFTKSDNVDCEMITAAYGACLLTRSCANASFAENRRSMITTNMIDKIGQTFRNLFGQ